MRLLVTCWGKDKTNLSEDCTWQNWTVRLTVVVEELLNEVDMGHQHSPTAVTFQIQGIQSFPANRCTWKTLLNWCWVQVSRLAEHFHIYEFESPLNLYNPPSSPHSASSFIRDKLNYHRWHMRIRTGQSAINSTKRNCIQKVCEKFFVKWFIAHPSSIFSNHLIKPSHMGTNQLIRSD
jgi:hypothetical protein